MKNHQNLIEFSQNIQLTTVSTDGIIKETETTLFNWKTGDSIYEIHPFFEILNSFIDDYDPNNTEFSFPCIHFENNDQERICDVTIRLDLKEIALTFFDYTQKYKELNTIAQQRNESILKSKELELKNQYLIEKEEFKNSFIANINHEIRTPLTSILGFVEVLEKTQLTFEQEELSRIIKRESHHLNALIDDMIDISKIESGKLQIVEELFSFQDIINGFKESYTMMAEEKEIDFEIDLDPNIQEYLIGDRTRMYQILNNLLNNAFKFTEEGSIKLSITKNYQRTNKLSLNFKIEDTGIGILKENLPQLFDRFTRFSGYQHISGTGLGLAIVKNLVDRLNGDIKVTSEPEKGTTFNVKLPFKFEITKAAPERKKKKYTLPENKGKFRVLIVEDKEVNQYLVMKILISNGNFYVDVAINGEDAIKYIEKRKYDVIIMDLMMHPIDGYQATRMIRNNYGDDHIAKVPIIGFSAKASENEREKCLRAGMDDFIKKPFGREDLIYKITRQIAKKAAD